MNFFIGISYTARPLRKPELMFDTRNFTLKGLFPLSVRQASISNQINASAFFLNSLFSCGRDRMSRNLHGAGQLSPA